MSTEAPPVGGFSLAGVAAIAAGFANPKAQRAGESEAARMERSRFLDIVHQVPISSFITITGGAGVGTGSVYYDGPSTGYYWSVRRLSIEGFTAGTVNVFKNSPYGQQFIPFATAGVSTIGRMEGLLNPDSTLYFVATGITVGNQAYTGAAYPGLIITGEADIIPPHLLPRYMGID